MTNKKPSSLLIQGGHIIDPSQGIDEIGSLLITEGKISWLGMVGSNNINCIILEPLN